MSKLPLIPPRVFWCIFLIGTAALFFCFARGGIYIGIKPAWGSRALQQSRVIDLAMYSYANDNNQKYPDGNSSTEVFQKLMDGGYVSDPTLFYLPLPGKTKGVGPKLKPENVCFDVTSGLEGNSPDEIPVVFMTGYRVAYVPGGSAVATIKPFPQFGIRTRTWSEGWNDDPEPPLVLDGVAVTYKSNSAMFKKFETGSNGSASIPNFISPDFKPDGKTYHQLTPDGILP